MLRVTPLYGSRWDNSGVSRSGSCTLVEYADIKVLVDVGIRNNNNNNDNNNNNTQNKIGNGDNNDDNNNNTSINTSNTASKSSESFWENLPPHDCLVLTDSTLESIGSLPLYVEGIRRAAKKRRHNRLVEIRLRNRRRRSSIQKQQQQQANRRRSSSNAANFQHEEEELLLDNDDNDDDKDYMDIVPPIFATFPTVKMGQMSLYDYHANISLDGCKPSFTLEEMDRSISLIRTIKYSQTLSLPFPLMEAPPSPFVSKTINNNNNKDEGKSTSNKPRLAITAHMAGHVVGGAFYKFVRLRDETSVVITHVYHIARELHLDAATLLRDGSGVDVLITYPGGSASCPLINTLYSSNSSKTNSSNNNKKIKQSIMKSPLVSKVRRDITERILGLLRRDANVLLPVDASGRSLELVLLLDRFWSHNNLSNTFNLVWFGPMVHNTLEFTRSQLEWMNSVLSANIFDHSQNNKKGGRRKNRFSQDKTGGGTEQGGDGDFDRGGHPYALRNVKLCTNMVELEKMISSSNDNPTCVLANGLSLDHGPARDLLLKWSDNDNNAILFTDSSECLPREVTATIGGGGAVPAIAAAAGKIDEATTVAVSGGVVAMTTTDGSTGTTAIAGGPIAVTAVTAEGALIDNEAAAAAEDDEDNNMNMMGKAVLEEDASKFTASYQILKYWSLAKQENREMDDSVPVDVLVPRRTPLIGQDLVSFLEQEESARVALQRREEEEAMLREVELAKGRLRLGEDGIDDAAPASTVVAVSTSTNDNTGTTAVGDDETSGAATGVARLPFFRPKKKSRFDSSLFLKFSKPLHLTFELREDAVGVGQRDVTAKFGIGESIENTSVLEDDYGIAVMPDQFRDIVTGVDPNKFGPSGRIGDEVSKRGLGYSASGSKGDDKTGGRGNSSDNKNNRRRGNDGTSGGGVPNINNTNEDADIIGNDDDHDDNADDERGLEAIDLSEGTGIVRGRNGRPPTKVSTVNRRIGVVAEIDYIPFEGRVDSRSARQSVRALQPRQVVVLGGTKPGNENNENAMDVVVTEEDDDDDNDEITLVDEVKALADAAKGFVQSNNNNDNTVILTPTDSETIELDVGHAAYPARLIATPFRTKEEKEKEEVRPDPMELSETKIGACTVSLLDFIATGQKVALDGSIVLAPRGKESRTMKKNGSSLLSNHSNAVYVSDGEVLLTDLRTELIVQHGMKAEYSAHAGYSQLIINGCIVVKKLSSSGKIDVEGPLCEDFFTVRSVVCNQYVTLL